MLIVARNAALAPIVDFLVFARSVCTELIMSELKLKYLNTFIDVDEAVDFEKTSARKTRSLSPRQHERVGETWGREEWCEQELEHALGILESLEVHLAMGQY